MNEIQPKANRFPDIHKMCLEGLLQRLSEAFGVPSSRVAFFTGTDRMALVNERAKQAGSAVGVQLPLLLCHLTSVNSGMTNQMHGFNAKSLARKGTYIKSAESNLKVRKIGVITGVFELEVFYLANTFDDAFSFATQWVANSVHNRLNFSLTYGGTSMDIRVEMSDNVTTPDKEASVDQPNYFEYSAGLRMAGYISDHHMDGDSDIEIIQRTVVGMDIMGAEGLEPGDRHVYSPRHEMEALKNGDVK